MTEQNLTADLVVFICDNCEAMYQDKITECDCRVGWTKFTKQEYVKIERFSQKSTSLQEAAENANEAYVNRFGTDAGYHGPIDVEMQALSRALKDYSSEPLNVTAEKTNLPCPFCGCQVDPEGWLGTDNNGNKKRGPECHFCGATAPTLGQWNKRHQFEPKKTLNEKLAVEGVFKGFHGLEGLYNAQSFWDDQSYGTRLYYGPGGLDYLHRSVLGAAIKALKGKSLESTHYDTAANKAHAIESMRQPSETHCGLCGGSGMASPMSACICTTSNTGAAQS